MSIHPAIAPGKVAVVTGGANGIGFAAAKRFADAGMRVVIADCDADALEQAKAQLGGEVLALTVDVGSRAAVEGLAKEVEARLGPVSVLMNNAGMGGGGDVLADPAGWDRLLSVNLMGMVYGVQAFVPAMAESDRPGLIINTGSKQGITQPPGNTAYNIAKSGVKSLTEGLAHTLLEKTGDRVTAHLLVPGFTYTGMMRRFIAEKPPAAWEPDQVIDVMMEGIERGSFYLWCLDNETTMEMDRRRVLWNTQDIIEDRPALSRWHPDFKQAYAEFIKGA